jgi:hypothetical protein
MSARNQLRTSRIRQSTKQSALTDQSARLFPQGETGLFGHRLRSRVLNFKQLSTRSLSYPLLKIGAARFLGRRELTVREYAWPSTNAK